MNKQVLKQIKSLQPGDLICVTWSDASIGKSLSGGFSGIDVPVASYGIFIGVLGEKSRHIILGQNHFRYANGLYDIDYTAIPVAWGAKITVVHRGEVDQATAQALLNSFLQGRTRTLKRRVKNHG